MAIKSDQAPSHPPPPGSSSSGGETEPLLETNNLPPSYTPNPSIPASGQNAVYPILPPSASRADQSYSSMGTPQSYTAQPQSAPPGGSRGGGGGGGLPVPVWAQASAREAADRRARWRVASALFWGFVIWASVGLLTGGIVVNETSKIVGRGKNGRVYPGAGIPPNQKIAHSQTCAQFSAGVKTGARSLLGPIYATSTSLAFPLSPEEFAVFYGAGSWSHGHLDIIRDPSISQAVVELEARYDDRALLDASAVCTVRDGLRRGVFVQTPEGGCHGVCPQLKFDVKYRIPAKLESLAGLGVNASVFSVSAKELFPINQLELATTNAAIELYKIDSATVKLRTTNAHITADGHASDSIEINSTNGKIYGGLSAPDVVVTTTNEQISGHFAVHRRLALVTTNGKITAAVDLVAPSDAEPTQFDVKVKSTNDKVDVSYDQQPFGSTLTSHVSSTNGDVLVKHHFNYEGTFALATSNGPATVIGPQTTHHPDHDALRREIIIGGSNKTARMVTGEIGWSGEGRGKVRGTSGVGSTNAHVGVVFA